jgi:hypothetical protein
VRSRSLGAAARRPGDARVEVLGDRLDDAALARGVAALEDHHHPQARGLDVLLELDELGVQALDLALVDLALDLPAPGLHLPVLLPLRGVLLALRRVLLALRHLRSLPSARVRAERYVLASAGEAVRVPSRPAGPRGEGRAAWRG